MSAPAVPVVTITPLNVMTVTVSQGAGPTVTFVSAYPAVPQVLPLNAVTLVP